MPSVRGFEPNPALAKARSSKASTLTMMRPARLHVVQVGLQRRRVHGHQHAGIVTGREDVVIGDVNLEGRHARQRPRRRPDLRREVRQGGQVVAEQRRGVGEPIPGELHPVSRITGKADDSPIQIDDGLLTRCGIGHGGPFLFEQ